MIDFGIIYDIDILQCKVKMVQVLELYMKMGFSYLVLIDEIEFYFFQ